MRIYLLLLAVAAYLIAFGTIWTAYESHVANIGVLAWQQQFDEIRHGSDAPPHMEIRPDNTPPQHTL